ncbi:MAG TPA: GNAT family N-acetyltransferase [Polyangiaceae bacterium]|nr:GNAT family N-acetyltransferase [Polyangiaceae bacterium]
MHPYHFDERYDERVRLEDGTLVHLRLIGPEDKALLLEGFARLSPASRYRRFFAAKRELSPQELRYFTEFDGMNHLAIGAIRVRSDRSEEGLGVARFVRLPDDPKVAEAAVVVVDDYQNKGLGHLLLLRLVAAARERGVERFRATTLADNPAARALMADLGAEPQTSNGDDTLSVDVALPEASPATAEMPPSSGLYRLFRAVARGIADVIQTHG